MDPATPFLFRPIAIRLVLAVLFGAAVGLDRELRREPAGLRTHALVALGAAAMAVIGLELSTAATGADTTAPSRIIQGLLAGIGFLGAGVIIRRPDPPGMHGLTTAASIWVVAAVGIATGLGLVRLALTTMLLTLVVLGVGALVDRSVGRSKSG